MNKIFLFLLILIGFSSLKAQDVYLFCYFKGNGEDGLHLAYSNNGRNWAEIKENHSYMAPTVGSKIFRDPNIYCSSDGMFHMVWTTGWWDNGFGYASSKDLIHWSEQKYIPSMAYEPTAKNTWAPEIIYDSKKKNYIIYWSSWIPGRFPKTDSTGHVLSNDPAKPKMSHRIYATATKDFENFTPTRLFYEPGFNVIDASIVKKGKEYLMFCKDETLTPPQKNIRIATSKKAGGPYGPISEPITGKYWAEGPAPYFVGDTCFVMFDKYKDHKYGAVMSVDLKNWKDVSDEITYPQGLRHGSVIKVSRQIFDALLKVE
jgi:hypothetical protein